MECRSAIDPSRLFRAADVLLEAIESDEGMDSVITVCVDDSEVAHADSTSAFSHAELVEAMSLLVRMGFVDPQQPHH